MIIIKTNTSQIDKFQNSVNLSIPKQTFHSSKPGYCKTNYTKAKECSEKVNKGGCRKVGIMWGPWPARPHLQIWAWQHQPSQSSLQSFEGPLCSCWPLPEIQIPAPRRLGPWQHFPALFEVVEIIIMDTLMDLEIFPSFSLACVVYSEDDSLDKNFFWLVPFKKLIHFWGRQVTSDSFWQRWHSQIRFRGFYWVCFWARWVRYRITEDGRNVYG